jgi:hypothetical protein
MISKNNLILLILFMIGALAGCNDEETEKRYFPGLIGAYYGDADLTNIKYPEILHSLDNEWDEDTGHGSSWSGKYTGYIISPYSGDIKFIITTNQRATVVISESLSMKLDSSIPEKVLNITAVENEKIPVTVVYMHEENRPGKLNISWEWEGRSAENVPDTLLVHDSEQAEYFNWLPEPEYEDIDFSQFAKVESKNVLVYYKEGRFAGWPANNGIWSWDDEIVVGFSLGYFLENPLHHSIDEKRGSDPVLSRSIDGGETWVLEGKWTDKISKSRSDKVNFKHPDLALRCTREGFYASYDRAKTWQGPFLFPDFGYEKITTRTDYITLSENECLFFLSFEDKTVEARLEDKAFAAITRDGGKSFEKLGEICPDDKYRAVMPSSIMINDGHIVTALRRRYDQPFGDERPRLSKNWIDVFESKNYGKSWKFLSKVADTDMGKHNGNPPSMIKLEDGRLLITYGYRAVPYSIRAKISGDNGKSWSKEIILRSDCREFDAGYTRTVQRKDGKIVTVYYIPTDEKYEQHIEATVWDPDIIEE